jgi:hypothetical protein
MKVLDLLLISLAGYCLLMMSHEMVVTIFKNANDWIPGLFSDSVQWHPGEVFHWGLASVIVGFLLVRFANDPFPTSLVVALVLVAQKLYPLIMANGITKTLGHTVSSSEMMLKYYLIMGLLPVITWIISLFSTPSREREVFRSER